MRVLPVGRPKIKPTMIVTAAMLPPTLLVIGYHALVKKYKEATAPHIEAVLEALANMNDLNK